MSALFHDIAYFVSWFHPAFEWGMGTENTKHHKSSTCLFLLCSKQLFWIQWSLNPKVKPGVHPFLCVLTSASFVKVHCCDLLQFSRQMYPRSLTALVRHGEIKNILYWTFTFTRFLNCFKSIVAYTENKSKFREYFMQNWEDIKNYM